MFVYGEGIQQEQTPQGIKQSILNPQISLRPLFIPSLFSFSVSFGIIGVDIKLEHTLRYTFKGPDEAEYAIDTGAVKIPPESPEARRPLPLEASGYLFNLDFRNTAFRKEGWYI